MLLPPGSANLSSPQIPSIHHRSPICYDIPLTVFTFSYSVFITAFWWLRSCIKYRMRLTLTRNIIRPIEILCDQSNVFLARIIFFCILLRAFSFLSVCIRDPASNWDPFNIILIVTGVEIVIGNCLPAIHKILPDFRNWEEKISNNGRWR